MVLFSPSNKLFALILLAVTAPATASPLFEDDTVLEIKLTGPLGSLIEDKENREEMPFVLQANGVEHLIKIRVRGKSRTRICSFPPLRLNLSGAQVAQSVFDGQNKLKLVTHCKNSASAQEDILEEYAAYRIFNLISDVSYKVRLARISFSDTDGKMKENTFVRYGYIIESKSELAERVGAKPVHIPGITLGSLDARQASLVFVFQYLIGNTDWSLVTAEGEEDCCHNGALFDIQSRRFLVPYDFDLSGLVNAGYARPDPSIRISKVTQRRYRGYCLSTEALTDAIRTIAEQKNDILAVTGQVPGLPEKNIEKTEKYLKKFFDQANNVAKLTQSFENKCL